MELRLPCTNPSNPVFSVLSRLSRYLKYYKVQIRFNTCLYTANLLCSRDALDFDRSDLISKYQEKLFDLILGAVAIKPSVHLRLSVTITYTEHYSGQNHQNQYCAVPL